MCVWFSAVGYTAVIAVNLLPWRDQGRHRQYKKLLLMLWVGLFFMITVCAAAYWHLQSVLRSIPSMTTAQLIKTHQENVLHDLRQEIQVIKRETAEFSQIIAESRQRVRLYDALNALLTPTAVLETFRVQDNTLHAVIVGKDARVLSLPGVVSKQLPVTQLVFRHDPRHHRRQDHAGIRSG